MSTKNKVKIPYSISLLKIVKPILVMFIFSANSVTPQKLYAVPIHNHTHKDMNDFEPRKASNGIWKKPPRIPPKQNHSYSIRLQARNQLLPVKPVKFMHEHENFYRPHREKLFNSFESNSLHKHEELEPTNDWQLHLSEKIEQLEQLVTQLKIGYFRLLSSHQELIA